MPKVTFFPIGNADTCLIELDNDRRTLFDFADMRNPDDKDDKRCDLEGEIRARLDGGNEIDVVAFAGQKEDLGSLRRALTDRRGAIVSFVIDKISPESYCYERSVCIDTTATGGNISLLTLQAS